VPELRSSQAAVRSRRISAAHFNDGRAMQRCKLCNIHGSEVSWQTIQAQRLEDVLQPVSQQGTVTFERDAHQLTACSHPRFGK